MSQLIQHYQTSFVIQGIDQDENEMLKTIQETVAQWVSKKENRRNRDLFSKPGVSFQLKPTWNSFKKRTSLKSKHSWCITNYCIMDESTAWAMQYTHRDTNERSIFWVTEFGAHTFANGKVIISVKVSYKLLTEFVLTGKIFTPDFSIPGCVKNILVKFKQDSYKIFSGGEDITAGTQGPIIVKTREDIERLKSYVSAEGRKLAVVILRGIDYPGVKHEANRLCENLFAKALVYVVGQNCNKIGRHTIEYGDCVFLPPLKYNTPIRYSASDNSDGGKVRRKELSQQIARAWLGTHPIHEDGAVCALDDVTYWIRLTQYKAESTRVQELQDKMQEFIPPEQHEKLQRMFAEINENLTAQTEAFKKDKAAFEARTSELEEANFELELQKDEALESAKKAKEEADFQVELAKEEVRYSKRMHAEMLHNVTATFQSQMLKSKSHEYVLPKEYPNSFENLQKFEKFYQHLVFAPIAWESALEYKKFNEWDLAWEMLHDLDQILWELIFERSNCDIEKEFNSQSRCTYAKGEGRQTNRDTKLARLREFEFDGKRWEMWTHLKSGNKDGKQLRIHFAIDRELKRLIVGYIGSHMDNATTRNMR